MEQDNNKRSKGGRPKKERKKDQFLAVKCYLLEKKIIRLRAKEARLSVSEFLLKMGLAGKIIVKEKHLPAEVLKLLASVSSVGNNLNQIARKRNSGDELNAIERAALSLIKSSLMGIIGEIKNYLYDRKSDPGEVIQGMPALHTE